MIFAAVGTQLPFPRMLRALDDIAGRHRLRIFAQTADPKVDLTHVEHAAYLDPSEFRMRCAESRVLVGHAGIGTILMAKELQKPLVIYPRIASLGEHRNDHQVATARALNGMEGLYVAWADEDLEQYLTSDSLEPATPSHSELREDLIDRLRSFIADGV